MSKLSRLEPGRVYADVDGAAYRVVSKVAGPDGALVKLADSAGRPAPAGFRPAALSVRRFASWMRWKLAYNRAFDLYINAYIDEWNKGHKDDPLPYPVGPDGKPFRWADWFQRVIAPKIHVPVPDYDNAEEIKDEAIHEMLFTVLGQRRLLDQFRDTFRANFSAESNRLDEANQLTMFLTKNFKFRVQEMRDDIVQRMPKDELSMVQPGGGEDDEEEVNLLETREHGVGEGEYEKAEARHDVGRLRQGFRRWLLDTQEESVAEGYVALFDLYWGEVLHAGERPERGHGDTPAEVAQRELLERLKEEPEKNRAEIKKIEGEIEAAKERRRKKKREETPAWMVSRRDMQDRWMERTGLSFGSFKEYLGRFPGMLENYIRRHSSDLGKASPFVRIVEKIRPARPARGKAVGASVQGDVAEAGAGAASPDSVDPDIVQATTSVPDAAKQGADLGKDYPYDRWETPCAACGTPNDPEEGIACPRGCGATLCGEQCAAAHRCAPAEAQKSAASKTARLVAGADLTPAMAKQVKDAFIYRWTFDSPYRTKYYKCDLCDIAAPYVNPDSSEGHSHPTIPLVSDEQWLADHAFHFTNDGRLFARRHAEPAYLAQHTASAEQRFAIEKAAYNPGEMAYMYQAAWLCEECGEKARAELAAEGRAPADPEDESSYDSDDFPKGPYPDGGGEADSPQHCDRCGKFLENPLTAEGYKYVREAIREGGEGVEEWADFYPEALEDEGCEECGCSDDRHYEGCSALDPPDVSGIPDDVSGEWVSPEDKKFLKDFRIKGSRALQVQQLDRVRGYGEDLPQAIQTLTSFGYRKESEHTPGEPWFDRNNGDGTQDTVALLGGGSWQYWGEGANFGTARTAQEETGKDLESLVMLMHYLYPDKSKQASAVREDEGDVRCVHCDVPIGLNRDPWGRADAWYHRLEDGPDAYTYCGDRYGTEAEPPPSLLLPLKKAWMEDNAGAAIGEYLQSCSKEIQRIQHILDSNMYGGRPLDAADRAGFERTLQLRKDTMREWADRKRAAAEDKAAMLGHDLYDGIRPDITPGDTGRLPHARRQGADEDRQGFPKVFGEPDKTVNGHVFGPRPWCKNCGASPEEAEAEACAGPGCIRPDHAEDRELGGVNPATCQTCLTTGTRGKAAPGAEEEAVFASVAKSAAMYRYTAWAYGEPIAKFKREDDAYKFAEARGNVVIVDSGDSALFAAKRADYTDREFTDELRTEEWLDRIREAEEEAFRAFAQDEDMKAMAAEEGVAIEELWEAEKDDFMAAYYAAPDPDPRLASAGKAAAPGDWNAAETVPSPKGRTMAVPPPIDQTPGPHSPNAPATAPRTPSIRPRVVEVPAGAEEAKAASEDANMDWELPGPDPNNPEGAADEMKCDSCGDWYPAEEMWRPDEYSVICPPCRGELEKDDVECPRCGGHNAAIVDTASGKDTGVYCEDCGQVTFTDTSGDAPADGPAGPPGEGAEAYPEGYVPPMSGEDQAFLKSMRVSRKQATWGDGRPNPGCPRAERLMCNEADADICCGGGADGPCDCEACHPAADPAVPSLDPLPEEKERERKSHAEIYRALDSGKRAATPLTAPQQQAPDPNQNPNVTQQQNIVRPGPPVPGQQGPVVAIQPGEAGGGGVRHTVEPDLPNAKYHMAALRAEEGRLLWLAAKTAGANSFFTEGAGRTAEEAFSRACDEAAHEHGHGGYTGTIAEKHGFRLLTPPPGVKPERYARWVLHGRGYGDDSLTEVKRVELKAGDRCPKCKKGKVAMAEEEFQIQPARTPWGVKEYPPVKSLKPACDSCGAKGWDLYSESRGHGPDQKFYYSKRVKIDEKYRAAVERDSQTVDDKWGPAGAVQLGRGKWLFFGTAPS